MPTQPENSHEDVVRRYYKLVDGGDVDGLIALFNEDSVYQRPGYQPLHGHQELKRFYTAERVIKEGRHDLDTVIVDGDSAAVRGTFSGVLRDGKEVQLRFADFFVFTQERFARRETFFFAPMV